MNIIVSLFPVLLFLLFLIYLDSFKLVKISDIIYSLAAGGLFALAAYYLNTRLISTGNFDMSFYTRYISPVIEELLKALFLLLLIKFNRAGFMIDGGILGFAIGAGFATVENIYYLNAMESSNLFVWVVRGLGTAIMHGGTTAIAAVIIMSLVNREGKGKIFFYFTAVFTAVIIHSVYNHFFLSPLISSLVILILLPLALGSIFQINEHSLRKWLDVEFDTESRLLAMINKGLFSETRAGKYILQIKNKFPAEIIVDLLGFIKIYLELSIRAKSILLMREAGFEIEKDKNLEDKMSEFLYLKKSIGKTGILALSPVFRFKSKDLWKINLLK
jgi:RsiW-degrading membrane proteinase PrsW (M82 family)